MKKKIIFFMLVCIGIFALGSISVSAETTGTYGYLTFEIRNGEVTITDCNEVATKVKIPTEIDGLPVTKIGTYAFFNCSRLTSINIPDSVVSIDRYAFYSCSGLTSVTIGNSVATICDSAFSGCANLKSINIPDSVTSIDGSAFAGCTSLTSVNVADIAVWCNISFYNLTSNPLYYAHNLYLNGELVADLVIPDGVTAIGKYAFYGCSGLTSITIPDSVTTIGNCAFYNCTGLTKINWNAINLGNFASNNALFCNAGTDKDGIDVVFGDNVEHIPAYLFYVSSSSDKSKITSVTIGNNVTTIGNSAFYNCVGLTSVTIGNGLTTIGDKAFYSCTGLTRINWNAVNVDDFNSKSEIFYNAGTSGNGIEVIFGNSAEYIPAYLFYFSYDSSCRPKITSVTIGNGVTSIGTYAFSNCTSLTSVNITDIAAWCNIDFSYGSDPLYYAHNLYLNGELVTDLVIPDSVTSIGDSVFSYCTSLKSVTIPDSVTAISDSAFFYCTSLTSVTIPDSVTSIGDGAFYGCRGLTSIIIPDSVTTIDSSAFYYCTGLTNVTIPDSVTTIGDSAFSECTGLTKINWNAKNVGDLGSTVFKNAGTDGNGIEVIFGDNVEHIPAKLFYGELKITSVTIGNNVTSIGRGSFSYCTSLTNVTIPDSVTSIGDGAFSNCTGLTRINWNAVNVDDFNSKSEIFYNAGTDGNGIEVIFGENVEYVPANLFCSSYSSGTPKITSVTIGNSVTAIGNSAFYNCTGLTTITIPDSVTTIGERAFYNCTGLTSIAIPDSVTTIGYGVFGGCTGLTSITIPKTEIGGASLSDIFYYDIESRLTKLTLTNETEIPDYAFENFVNLTDITLNDGIEFIGKNAFNNCGYVNDETNWDGEYLYLCNYLIGVKPTVVNSVVRDGTISMIDGAFQDCTDLLKVTLPESMISIANCAFDGCTSLFRITIPSNVRAIGNDAFCNCDKLTKINIPSSVTRIGNDAFEYCSKLEGVYISDVGAWCKIVFSGKGIWDSSSNPLNYAGKLYVNDVLVETITVPDGITKLNDYVFYNCQNLKTIILPDSVAAIGAYAFYGCANLSAVNMSNRIADIGSDAFRRCYNIGVVCISDLSAWCKIKFEEYTCNPLSSGAQLILNGEPVTDLIIPDDITVINANAFYNCKSITGIKIPGNVDKIEENAFYGCSNAEYVEIPENVFYIRNNAFYGCDNISEVRYSGTDAQWDDIIIADGNEILTNAQRKKIHSVTLIDSSGNESSITCIPGERIKISDVEKKYMHKVKLYTDEAMTKEFDAATAINEDLILYVYIDFNGTKTTVSGDGKTFTVKPINIEKGNTVVLALYDNGKFVDMQSAIFDGKDLRFSTEATYTNAKVMVWSDLASLKPICGIETVK